MTDKQCNFGENVAVSGKCECDCDKINNNIQLLVSDEYNVNSTFIDQFDINIIQLQLKYEMQFDVKNVSHVVSTLTQDNYIFGSDVKSLTNNIYIKLINNLFSQNIVTLFQYQKEFNHIKIEVGDQQVQYCPQLLTAQTNIRIYNMIIASTENTKISTTGAFQFNVLQSVSKGTHLVNFLLNLTILNSQASLCLIGSLSEYLIVKGYQVCGQYQSTNLVALGCFSSNASIIKVSQLNVMPSVFEVGNQSSFLFSSVNASTVDLLRIHITQGAAASLVTRTTIATSNVTYFQFGGLVSQISNSSIIISQLASLSYVKYGTQFVNTSGALVGVFQSPKALCSVSTVNITGLVSGTSAASLLLTNQSGVVGTVSGNVTFSNSFFSLRSDFCSLNSFGLVGVTDVNSQLSYFDSIQIQLIMSSNKGDNASSLIGVSNSARCTVYLVQLFNSSIFSAWYAGGFISVSNSIIKFSNCSIIFTKVSAATSAQSCYAGGLASFSQQLSAVNVSISSSQFFSSSYSSFESFAGSISGRSSFLQVNNLSLLFSGVFSSSARSISYSGGIIGSTLFLSVQNVNILQANVTTNGFGAFSGGIGGYLKEIMLNQIIIINLRLKGLVNGVIVGSKSDVVGVVSNARTEGVNYINDFLVGNCAEVDYKLVNGC
ncbi:Hypothetical_protein [Hexamita inflata]|uniref:Hypothetical_protein n=1 Tax=Hexamita inflata TaxID=28002 RepID=A0AA86QJ17_9EUKA|nr:Hypothetical protein HINF_LOCUS40949 [Hexamita inflata]CAI9959640.1 Hypothetical protein HINF_LOCUS47285 [Hexamita inflata]